MQPTVPLYNLMQESYVCPQLRLMEVRITVEAKNPFSVMLSLKEAVIQKLVRKALHEPSFGRTYSDPESDASTCCPSSLVMAWSLFTSVARSDKIFCFGQVGLQCRQSHAHVLDLLPKCPGLFLEVGGLQPLDDHIHGFGRCCLHMHAAAHQLCSLRGRWKRS